MTANAGPCRDLIEDHNIITDLLVGYFSFIAAGLVNLIYLP